MRISDWSSDVCSSDLSIRGHAILRWYSLAYIGGILIGWWYLLTLLEQPGAPMAKRHADDLVFYATIGVILGGRNGVVLFYVPGKIGKVSWREGVLQQS